MPYTPHSAPRPSRRALAAAVLIAAACALGALVVRPGVTAPTVKPGAALECRWTDFPVAIDGRGDDRGWKSAAAIDGFSLPWLGKDARPAQAATRAKLLWDRENLYFLAEMEDDDLYAEIREHDGKLWFNDVFELFFKPADDRPGYYEFQVNPAGAV